MAYVVVTKAAGFSRFLYCEINYKKQIGGSEAACLHGQF